MKRRLKYAVKGCANGVWGDEPNDEDDLIVVRVADFDRERCRVRLGDLPTIRAIPQSARNRRCLEPGDLLIEKSGGGEQQPVGNVVLFDDERPAVCSNFVARMPVAAECDSRFVNYVFRAMYSEGRNIPHIKQTSGIQNLDSESYLNELAWLPDKGTQKAIANFLDEQTARIDALIAEKERLIALVDELRDGVCRDALSRGHATSIQLVDSGDQFVGRIPAHWSVLPWKRLGQFTGGAGFPVEYQGVATEELPFFKVKDLDAENLLEPLTETDNTVSRETAAKLRATVFNPGTLTFAKVGAALLLLRVRRLGVPCCIDNNMMAFVPNESVVYPIFAQLALGNLPLDWLVNPGAVPSVSASQVGDVKLALPGIEEQRSIANFVLTKFDEYSRMHSHLLEHVLRLREYRSSLISAAVTGQLNIDDFQARQLEAA